MAIVYLTVLIMTGGLTLSHAGEIHTHEEGSGETQELIHQAGHAVDHAWEAFHKAALGGTLASPALQMKIEKALGAARGLLVEARDAAEQGEDGRVKRLTSQIKDISDQIIKDSQRRKQ